MQGDHIRVMQPVLSSPAKAAPEEKLQDSGWATRGALRHVACQVAREHLVCYENSEAWKLQNFVKLSRKTRLFDLPAGFMCGGCSRQALQEQPGAQREEKLQEQPLDMS